MPNNLAQSGFTLIEMMAVVVIIGMLSAIAIPSYQKYALTNTEKQIQTQMEDLQLQLERWRATALTYNGFVPYRGNGQYGYDTIPGTATLPNTVIKYPIGSSNPSYLIELLDGTSVRAIPAASGIGTFDGRKSLSANNDSGNNIDVVLGRSWVMVAYPASKRLQSMKAHKFFMHSNGYKCKAAPAFAGNLTTASKDCSGTGVEIWQ